MAILALVLAFLGLTLVFLGCTFGFIKAILSGLSLSIAVIIWCIVALLTSGRALG